MATKRNESKGRIVVVGKFADSSEKNNYVILEEVLQNQIPERRVDYWKTDEMFTDIHISHESTSVTYTRL